MSVIIRYRPLHARGSDVAGLDGRLYRVGEDSLLRLIEGGVPSDEAGCHPDDAAEWAPFREFILPKAEKAAAPPPPPKAKRAAPPPPKSPEPSPVPASEEASAAPAPGTELEDSSSDAQGDPQAARRVELHRFNKKKQKVIAKALGLTGYTKLNEDDLVAAILAAEAA